MSFFTLLLQIKTELSNVVWPTRREFFEAVFVVCVVVAFFALVLGAADFFFSQSMARLFSFGG